MTYAVHSKTWRFTYEFHLSGPYAPLLQASGTTAKRADFQLIHEKRQIRQFMEFVLVREDYERTKPHPEPYLTGLMRFGATKEETLVVEDSNRGLNSAVAAGIDCAIVHNDFIK
ncbi:HAD family hydrolase [Paenibacillus prosopidis]|uniref:HAD family hydrolase n=1 Tax=Paenibacillus prosopidis TaxID=630520 RepID=UPI001FE4D205|nr:HAD family hydrolase [Paenibacillus prosopidis]